MNNHMSVAIVAGSDDAALQSRGGLLKECTTASINGKSTPLEPVALTNAEVALREIRREADWEALRRQVIAQAIYFTEHLVFDLRLMLTQGRNVEMAGRLMWQLIRPFSPEVIVGPGFGAAPLLFSVSLAALKDGVNLHVLMVRDKRKEHNQKKWVEGKHPPAGARAIMIDDFMNDGSALPLVERALLADKLDIQLTALALFFDMWQPLGSRQISTSQYPVISLFTRHDIGLSRDCFDAVAPLMKGAYPDFIEKPMWWRFSLNEKVNYPHKCVPVIAENAVFVADDHCRVWRHDALTGNIDWCYESLDNPAKGIVQLLQYAEGSLVFGCYDGTITRLNAATGEVIWRWRQDSSVHATPELDLENDRLYVATEQWNDGEPFGHLQALNWKTGRMLWTYSHAYWPPGSPALDSVTQTVFSSCNDQTLSAFDAGTGQLLWTKKTNGLVRGKPAVADDLVIVATEAGRLQAFNISDGTIAWTSRYGKGERHQFVHVQDGLVYALDGKWHFTAFEVSSGKIKWLSRLRSPGCWGPVQMGRFLVVTSREGHIAVFDPALELKVWEGKIEGKYYQPGAIGVITQDDGTTSAVYAAASNDSGLRLYAVHGSYVNADVIHSLQNHTKCPQLDSDTPPPQRTKKVTPINSGSALISAEITRRSALLARVRKQVIEASKALPVIDKIERFAALDSDSFRREAGRGMPFVMSHVVSSWEIASMTRQQLIRRFANTPVNARVGNYVELAFTPARTMVQMPLADYAQALESSTAPHPPYLCNQQLPGLSALCNWPDYFQNWQEPRIWLGPQGTVTPLHCDYDDNLFAQVWGSKRFILFPPNHDAMLNTRQANPALYASRFDPENPDYEKFPLARYATPIKLIVLPGDMLFLPAGWFHHVRSLDWSLSANRWTHDEPLALHSQNVSDLTQGMP